MNLPVKLKCSVFQFTWQSVQTTNTFIAICTLAKKFFSQEEAEILRNVRLQSLALELSLFLSLF